MGNVTSNQHRTLWILLAVLWVGVIFAGSSTAAEQFCNQVVDRCAAWWTGDDLASPPDLVAGDRFWLKKAAHVILFLVLAFVLSQALKELERGTWAYVLAIGVMVGIVSEFIQNFFPTREPTIRDVLINAAATLVGATVFAQRSRGSRESSAVEQTS
jgi:VanZ family protein